ncbi:MAG: hypothetical protein PHX83_12575 [Acidobacteriia bacterium]|nr:hypothetical protein [Terriglobia bacterium]
MKNVKWSMGKITSFFLLLAATALLLAGCGGMASNESADPNNMQPKTGVGALYGSRDPFTCKSTKAPAHGAISADQARQYVICGAEGETGGALYLIEDVKTEVGKSRPFNINSDDYPDIDPSSPLYPVRGSFTKYQCFRVSNTAIASLNNAGKNCNSADQPQATGVCYRTTFGDWRCGMSDMPHLQLNRFNIPPPKQ